MTGLGIGPRIEGPHRPSPGEVGPCCGRPLTRNGRVIGHTCGGDADLIGLIGPHPAGRLADELRRLRWEADAWLPSAAEVLLHNLIDRLRARADQGGNA